MCYRARDTSTPPPTQPVRQEFSLGQFRKSLLKDEISVKVCYSEFPAVPAMSWQLITELTAMCPSTQVVCAPNLTFGLRAKQQMCPRHYRITMLSTGTNKGDRTSAMV